MPRSGIRKSEDAEVRASQQPYIADGTNQPGCVVCAGLAERDGWGPSVPYIQTGQHLSKAVARLRVQLYGHIQSEQYLCPQTTASAMGKFTHLLL